MIEFREASYKLNGFYRGKVLDNNDPDKLGRIKVEVYDVLKGIEAPNLPWAIPAMPLFVGAGNGYGSFNVPEVGSYVWCFFECGDLYQPVYFAEAQDGVHGLPAERATSYPYRRVMKTKNGIVIYVDDTSREIKVEHPSGAYLKIDSSGNIIINGISVNINP